MSDFRTVYPATEDNRNVFYMSSLSNQLMNMVVQAIFRITY